jgi:hypothetical protein
MDEGRARECRGGGRHGGAHSAASLALRYDGGRKRGGRARGRVRLKKRSRIGCGGEREELDLVLAVASLRPFPGPDRQVRCKNIR